MSLVHSVQYELSNSLRTSLSTDGNNGPEQSRPSSITVVSPPLELTAMEAGSPPAQRRVFDVAPLNVMGKTRKTAITVLIIGSNLVQARQERRLFKQKADLLYQMMSSFVTIGGIGGALILPNAVAMLAITTPPGRMRNLSLGFFSASAPLGGWLGALLAGVFLQIAPWKWMFFFLAMLGALVLGALWILFPPEKPVDPHGKIDYVGAVLGTSALILFNFVWNQAPAVGWATPYEIGLLVTSIILLAGFIVWEKKFAAEPIMPLDIFKAPSFGALVLVTLLSYMSVGTSLWYMVEWQQTLRHWSVLSFALGWIPFGICAILAGFVAAWLIPRLGAQWIIALGAGSILLTNLLMTTMPEQQTYWAQMFPATILMAFCPDLVYTAAQIIASNSVRRHQQGIAGSLIGTLNLYGNSLGLGFAGTVEVETSKHGRPIINGYRSALWFGVGIAAVALILDMAFVRMAKDDREGWADENDRDPADEGVAMASGAVLESESRRVASRNS
ncbi:MAG: hypothetical protein Q9165_001588 [Trypethelium subeluteriae]